MPDHLLHHVLALLFFSLDVGDDRALDLGCYEVRVYLICLTKAPESADGLIDLLETVIESDKACIVAMLPVHAESAYGGFRD